MLTLSIVPLTKAGFAPFGDVVETGDVKPKLINEGFAERFDELANIDVAAEGGEVNVSLFIGSARPVPLVIKLMERHPLGSQLFMPLGGAPWLVVVCTDPGVPLSYRAFAASGRQGVNYARNCWHHPLLVVGQTSPFIVVDRKGTGSNLEEKWLEESNWLRVASDAVAPANPAAKQG
ncbi:ureidoglycolate lyase [Bradyrhizobium sp. JYMT SZCCT0180]|uniref:ureidoglycolate lyase n=1 Tax=Bradyrhizobium sp. JYMT SZCCT0180 TaxID=2807666 RepID=UPI001BA5097C|nr:ureidoglycolate lyase [Bradyrhizobium sp. JYMT SZCCT0180]MBR1212872.1 ureidoglycolate lyase [Bradyrhizobium sp. JYMT SZCCT0180]